MCKFKFSAEQTEKILGVVNSCNIEDLSNRYAITPARAKKIELFRQRKEIESIDEVLSFGVFSETGLNKFFDSILTEVNPGDGTVFIYFPNYSLLVECSLRPGNKKAKNRSYIFPPMSRDTIQQINSFTSIHCGIAGFSWATFKVLPNQQTEVIHWDLRKLPEPKLNLYKLATFVENVFNVMPQSDFYVLENPTSPYPGSAKVGLQIQLSQMIGMASVLASQKNTLLMTGDSRTKSTLTNVAFLRKYLSARLYIGSEQISTIEYVDNLVSNTNVSRIMDENIQSVLDINENVRSFYLASKNCDKDFLGCSLLLGVAFLRLCLVKCPESLKLLEK
ncbi:Transcription elongation factor, mitochondrial, partial [Pseudolycoriella hygida]